MFKKIMVGFISSAMIISSFPVAMAAPLGSTKSSSTSSSSKSKTGSSFNRNSSSNKQSSSVGSSNRGVLGSSGSMGRQSSVLQDRLRSGDRSGPSNNTTVASNNRNNNYAGNTNSRNNNGYNSNNGYNNNNGNYNNGYNQPRQGHSTGALIGAAAAGAIGGYMLNGILHNNDGSVHNGPGYVNGIPQSISGAATPAAYDNSPAYANNGNGTNYNSSNSGGSVWWSLLGFLLVLAFIFAAYKYFTRNRNNNLNQGSNMFDKFVPSNNFNTQPQVSPEDKIRDSKEKIFTTLQTNFKPSGLDLYRQYSTPEFFEQNLKEAVLNTNEDRTIKVRSLEANLVELTQDGTNYIASVVYDYVIVEQEHGAEAEEYSGSQGWTFIHPVNGSGEWKLDGITVKS